MAEHRCFHGILRSVVPCEICDRVRAKQSEAERKKRARIGEGTKPVEGYSAFGRGRGP
jgi:hypothetical protein